MTRNGIEYDLQKSPYRVEAENVVYVFSSKLYGEKFKQKLEGNRKILYYLLLDKFGVSTNLNILADIQLYRSIEKRGFLILTERGQISCHKNLTLSGEIKINPKQNEP